MKKVAKAKVGKINLTGFVIVTKENYGRDTVFWIRETTRNSDWIETDSDLRAAKVFNSEKSAQKFIDNVVKNTGSDIGGHVAVPISNYIATGYRWKDGKAVKVKCFKCFNKFYSIEGKKSRGRWISGYTSLYTVYETAVDCIRKETKGIKEEIRCIKEDIKRSTKELKDLEKQLKKLNAGV